MEMPTKTSSSPVVLMVMLHLPLWEFLLLLSLQAGSITELWGVWDRHWTAVLVRVWLLSAGGWSCTSWERRSWLCACMREKEGGKQREDNRSCVRGKPLLELHVCSIRGHYTQKLTEGKEETQLHNYISQGGRFSFDLDLSVHSLHA